MFSEKVTFSLPCLKSLVSSYKSCVFCQTNFKRSLMLLPLHLNNLKQSVKEILASKVTTYDIELGGIILSHKNVKLANSVEMSNESYFRLDYVCDIYIFKPEIGSILTGRINKKGRGVLGCLVHSVFNVALPRSSSEMVGDYKKWIGSKASIGQFVTFSVDKLDFTGRLPYIRGEILSLDSGVDDDDGADSGMGCHESTDGEIVIKEELISPSSDVTSSPHKHSKRKRKHLIDGSVVEMPKSKKKKKSKR